MTQRHTGSPVATATAMMALCAAAALCCSGCFLFQRPNPRLVAMKRTVGESEATVKLGYDADGFLERVVQVDDQKTQTLRLTWNDDHVLRSVEVTDDPLEEAFPTVVGTTTFGYDNQHRLIKATESVDDPDPDDDREPAETRSALSWDASGRIQKLRSSTSADGSSVNDETRFGWADDGTIEKMSSSRTVIVNDAVQSKTSTTFDIQNKDGIPDALTITTDDFSLVLEAAQDDRGRIDSFDGTRTASDGDTIQHVLVSFSYDDADRLSAVTSSDDDGLTDDPVTELQYDDGEAQGIDVTPYSVFFFGLWDLKGQGHLQFDAPRQAARFVMPTW